jgi:hydrogenase maturation protease
MGSNQLGAERRVGASAESAHRIGVVGIGSVLMGDDGIGPYAVELLDAGWALPPEVLLQDAGTPGPELVQFLMDLDAVIVIDTVRATGRAGELRFYRRDDVMCMPTAPRLSPHDPDLRQALLTAELAGRAPTQVLVVGVVPGRVELGTELSPEVRAALPAIGAAVRAELERLGAPAVRRSAPRTPRIWWERPDPDSDGARQVHAAEA